MAAGIRTHICEPDIFARQWMSLLVVRDWHTKLVGESANVDELIPILSTQHISVILLSASLCNQHKVFGKLAQILTQKHKPPQIIWVGQADRKLLATGIPEELVAGCIAPQEINWSLAWAVHLAAKNHIVLTRSALPLLGYWREQANRQVVILDGFAQFNQFDLTDHDKEMIRYAFLFSVDRADLDDEMGTAQNTPAMQISRIYKKIGLYDLVRNGEDPFQFFRGDEVMIAHYEEIMQRRKGRAKTGDETLAYHILTMPHIEYLKK